MASCVSPFPFSEERKPLLFHLASFLRFSWHLGKYCTRQISHFTYVEKSSSPLPLRLRQSSLQNFIKFFPVFPCLLFFTGKRVTRTAQPVWEGKKRRRSEQLSWTWPESTIKKGTKKGKRTCQGEDDKKFQFFFARCDFRNSGAKRGATHIFP